MEAANERAQDASGDQAPVEYVSLEAAEIERTAEKDKHLLVFGEDRLIFLADAVFAIAMTLLVLEITLPAGEHISDEGHFNEALVTLIEQTAIYLVTFAVLARYWMAHRSLMRLVDRLDSRAIWLTFLFLAFVAFFPVPSGILGDYDFTGAVALFTLALVGCGYSLLALWLYVSGKNRLLARAFRGPRLETAASIWRWSRQCSCSRFCSCRRGALIRAPSSSRGCWCSRSPG
jgi:uncharacterized membrane protein